MTTTISGQFDTGHEAREAQSDLESIGVSPSDILLTGTEGAVTHPHIAEGEADTATGVLVGGGTGFVTGLAVAAIAAPVVAPIAAAGFVAAAGMGALVGGAAGDLAATLKSGSGDDGDESSATEVPVTLSATVDDTLVTSARHAMAAHGADGVTQGPATSLHPDADRVLVTDRTAARVA